MITELKGKTILIVDDDPASLFLFSELLHPYQAIILTASDGASAFNVLSKQEVDLVLLDIKLTDTTGFAMLKEIRIKYKSVKVIAQTAYALEVFHECREAGFDDFIGKPIIAAELINKMEKLLKVKS